MSKYSLIIFSAFLMGLSQHPIYLGFFAWIAFIPALYFLEDRENFFDFFKAGIVWGIVYHLTSIFWLSMNIGTNIYIAILTMFLSVIVLTFNTVVIFSFLYLFKKFYFKKYVYFLPLIWIFIEYVKSYGVLGFPWVSLANTQIDYLILIQNAELFGIYGITFWILFFNITLYNYLKSDTILLSINRKLVFCSFVFFMPWFSGLALYKNIKLVDQNQIDIGIVQPNIKLEEKWSGNPNKNFNKVLNLTQKINNRNNILIWPESALPAYFFQSNSYQMNKIYNLLNDSTYLVTGTTVFVKDSLKNKAYNSIAYIGNNYIKNYYNKIQLVPMAEYVPWSNIFNSLKDLNLGQANFSKGEDYTIFNYNQTKFGAVVCYESTFPWIFNEFVNKGAEFMVVVTNDGWYETAPEPQQHAKQAVYRAIENRKPIIRCANTGISMVINARGDIVEKLELNKSGVISASIIPNTKKTFYNKYEDNFIQLLGLILLIFILKPVFYKHEK